MSLAPALIVTFSNLPQLENAYPQMLLTVLGIITCVRSLQPENAPPPIPLKPVRFKDERPLKYRLVSIAQPSKRLMPLLFWKSDVLQSSKAPCSILVTLLGMLMLVKAAQLRNALILIVVTPCGITMPSTFVQFSNAKRPILVTGLPPSVEGIVTVPPWGVGKTALLQESL